MVEYLLCLQTPRKEPVYLSGYGVELAIKSTEYKAKDDTQVKGEFVNETNVFSFLKIWVKEELFSLMIKNRFRNMMNLCSNPLSVTSEQL